MPGLSINNIYINLLKLVFINKKLFTNFAFKIEHKYFQSVGDKLTKIDYLID
jgi:hypothetical protein